MSSEDGVPESRKLFGLTDRELEILKQKAIVDAKFDVAAVYRDEQNRRTSYATDSVIRGTIIQQTKDRRAVGGALRVNRRELRGRAIEVAEMLANEGILLCVGRGFDAGVYLDFEINPEWDG